MRRLYLILPILILAACGDDDDNAAVDARPSLDGGALDASGTPKIDVTADIGADTTWTADHIYELKTHIFVKDGATLTIEPGVTVLGNLGTSLVITANGKIDARGTAALPILFTSAQEPGLRAPADWGGVVLLGRASINVAGGTEQVEGFPDTTPGIEYGGSDDAHDCGTMRYVRIEFAGYDLAVDNELNGLTVGGCGSATDLEYIQVHRGKDDGIEFFGGTANIKHAIISQTIDDGIDWDFGWRGKAQFVIVQEYYRSNEGIEADNNKNAVDSSPRSSPQLYNVTLVGSFSAPGTALDKQMGMHLRRGTAGAMYNFIVTGFTDFPIDVDGAQTVLQTPTNLFVKNSIFFQNGSQENWTDPTDNDGNFDEGAYFKGEATNLQVDPKLGDARSLTAPDFKPATDSPALVETNAAPTPEDPFFTAAPYLGAVGPEDWTAGWTAYPQD